MGQIFLHSERKIRSALVESRMNVETILFPEWYYNALSPEQRKALPKRILPLLRRYQKLMLSKKRINPKAGKTLYQKTQGMVRVNVRIDTGVWAVLGVLSAAHGVSRCFMVNYLLWLDDSGVGDSIDKTLNVGSPAFHDNYSYIWHLDLLKNSITRTIEFEPNPIWVMERDYYS
ncbi:DUF1564 domain-containing protein [Leptospira sp. 201903071]|uniref:DUF1564 domain-containing protein n=1 Tax=Leptospira ainazelensis TaxID=2810034 RepID=UPI001965C6FD|nr:DUF1564 domain-containing protein [Leptospira ainazelensis]MBM9502323.1 DUF1564 domain-containing protein [Leptospira ainazelensis]